MVESLIVLTPTLLGVLVFVVPPALVLRTISVNYTRRMIYPSHGYSSSERMLRCHAISEEETDEQYLIVTCSLSRLVSTNRRVPIIFLESIDNGVSCLGTIKLWMTFSHQHIRQQMNGFWKCTGCWLIKATIEVSVDKICLRNVVFLMDLGVLDSDVLI
ncbi:hypothetical protein JTB14_013555 [Gonioctena quinquepunctata]|nr:hypothetical protein JTB14_013555 [Gonioctena quinquepunctata]